MNKMQFPIEMFSKGSVIFIDFVYDDKPEKSKERPAIVMDYSGNGAGISDFPDAGK